MQKIMVAPPTDKESFSGSSIQKNRYRNPEQNMRSPSARDSEVECKVSGARGCPIWLGFTRRGDAT